MARARIIFGSTILEGESANMDLRWLIEMELSDPHLFVELGEGPEDRVLLISPLELTRARNQAKNCRVESVEPYLKEAGGGGMLRGLAAFLKKHGVSHVVLHPETPCSVSENLRDNGFTVEAGKLPWYPNCWIRTDEEISYIEEVQRKVEEVLELVKIRLAQATISDGLVMEGEKPLTSEAMRESIETELYLRGCISFSTIVSSGGETAIPHDQGSGPLKANGPIIFDIYPRSRRTGRFADMTRTMFKGRPEVQVLWAYEIVLEGQELGISMIRDGVDGRTVHTAIKEYFAKKGFKTNLLEGSGFTHGTGHSLNLRYHEPPGVNLNSYLLKKGMVVTVEPGLYYPDRGWGIRIEDLVVVEENGCRNLTQMPKDLDWAIIP